MCLRKCTHLCLQETREGYILEGQLDITDRRTAAEKRYDEKMAKRERERVAKAASKSHRERVNEFNTYLQNLSEHHDIPRVGPG
jgi:protein FAM32A